MIDSCENWSSVWHGIFPTHVVEKPQTRLLESCYSTAGGGPAMRNLDSFKARAYALARSGHFYGLPPLEFELSFEEGFHEAREWLKLASTKEELERLCQESRARHKAA